MAHLLIFGLGHICGSAVGHECVAQKTDVTRFCIPNVHVLCRQTEQNGQTYPFEFFKGISPLRITRPRGEVSVCIFLCHPDLSIHCLIDEPFTHLLCVLTGSSLHRNIIVLCVCYPSLLPNLLNMITQRHFIFFTMGHRTALI